MRTLKINIPLTSQIKNECIKSKELYNALNYLMRQQYFKLLQRKFSPNLTSCQLNIMNHIKFNVHYPFTTKDINKVKSYCNIQMHAKVTQSLVNNLAKNWKTFFALKKKKIKCKMPHYKQKYNKLMFNKQTISQSSLQKGHLKTYLFDVKVPKIINESTIQSCELSIDSHGICTLYVQYHEVFTQHSHQLRNVAGLDLGVAKLATIGFDTTYRPLTYDSCLIRSINQGYNRLIAQAQQNNNLSLKHHLFTQRNRKMKHLLHKMSNIIIQDLLYRDVCTLVIGKNNNWKYKVNHGKKNNQNFVQIPFNLFVKMLLYKCEAVGIKVVMQEESYTSQASFMNNDDIPVYGECDEVIHLTGKRQGRHYRNKNTINIHADVNGALNILKKSNQSDNVRLSKVRHWLARGCRVVQPIGRKITFN